MSERCPFCSKCVVVSFGGNRRSCLICYMDFKVDIKSVVAPSLVKPLEPAVK